MGDLFDVTSFPARWLCGRWSPELGWTHIVADLLIFASYFAIPALLLYAMRRRDWPFPAVGYLFVAFILSCGFGHLLEAMAFWWPAYRLIGAVKVVTAVVSVATVGMLAAAIPAMLRMPGLPELRDQIEEGKRVRVEMARLVEKLQRVVNQAPFVVWTVRDSGAMIESFASWGRFTGLLDEQSAGLGWLTAFHPDHRDILLGQFSEGRPAFELRTRVWNAETLRYHHGELRAWRVGTSEGSFEWLVILTDVDRAVESESRFQLVVESSPTAMVMVNRSGEIVMVNREAERLFGHARAAMIGQSVDQLLVPPNRRGEHKHHREGFHQEPSLRYMADRRDLSGYRADGTEVPIEVALNPIGDNDLVLALIQDVSKRRSAEEAQRRYTDELLSLNRSLDQFVYAASHDLRAPLRAIQHLVDWIEEGLTGICPPSVQCDLATLRRRVTRLDSLLTGLLEYSRAGRRQSSRENIDLGQMIREIVETQEIPPGFHVDIAPGLPNLTAERAPVYQVFANLISNAIRHHDRSTGVVQVRAESVDGAIEFSVVDDGPGIAPEHQDRVFQMFETLRPRDEVEGMGIGLALVKKLVESQGGKVTLESPVGERGSRFRFTWPVREVVNA